MQLKLWWQITMQWLFCGFAWIYKTCILFLQWRSFLYIDLQQEVWSMQWFWLAGKSDKYLLGYQEAESAADTTQVQYDCWALCSVKLCLPWLGGCAALRGKLSPEGRQCNQPAPSPSLARLSTSNASLYLNVTWLVERALSVEGKARAGSWESVGGGRERVSKGMTVAVGFLWPGT